MDNLDRLIIRSLQEDGRTPFTRIAERGGVSEATVRSRYHKLEKAGFVRTVGVADPVALGFRASALIAIAVEAGRIDGAATQIGDYPEVSYLAMTLGTSDLIAEVHCRDLEHLTELVIQQIGTVPGVRSAETLVIGRRYKLSASWRPSFATKD